MSQSILTVPIESFRAQAPRIPSPQLLSLIRGIYEIKWNVRAKLSDDAVGDLERKETICQYELQRRGYLTKKDYADFMKWRASHYKKKIY